MTIFLDSTYKSMLTVEVDIPTISHQRSVKSSLNSWGSVCCLRLRTSRIKESKYYSISLDSTPDEGHFDQLTLVFRYMEKTNPVERFVKFMPNQGHKAQDMFDGLVDFLDEH